MKGRLIPATKKWTPLSRIKEAMLDELAALRALEPAVIQKIAAITDEEARQSLDRLETLEKQRPDRRQVARYAGLGAVASPVIHAAGKLVAGKGLKGALEGETVREKIRDLAGHSVKGALGFGAVPLVRGHMDRSAESSRLKRYLAEHKTAEVAASVPWRRAVSEGLPELVPAITGGLGAILAAKYDKPVSAGAALGGSIGAIPYILMDGKKK